MVDSIPVWSQIDTVGSGRAIHFDGVDDYINLGNTYDDLTLPFTISAWIYISANELGGPIFVSQDNDPIYNGFWFIVNPTTIFIEYGDGKGQNHPAYRRGKSATVPDLSGRWVHVCAVMKAAFDIDLYINGINVGGSSSGQSNSPMASNFPNDVAKIGYFLSNGIEYRFKGTIDDIQFFKSALTADEIRQNMTKKLTGDQPNLIGYWSFDEISGSKVLDKSVNNFDGTVNGDPQRVYSGAPIGNENSFLYPDEWNGAKLTLSDLSADSIMGNPGGAHIYKVNTQPSQIGGLDAQNLSGEYYGVFLASLFQDKTFSVKFKGDPVCKLFTRTDNSQSVWIESETSSNISDRMELIPVSDGQTFEVKLGDDKTLCDQTSYLLQTNLTETMGKEFLWNTGENTSSITVTQSGKYSVKISEGCFADTDTVNIAFINSPPDFTLGNDETVCGLVSKTLKPLEIGDYTFTWQNGSHGPSFDVKDYGIYWLKIENVCGQTMDSIEYTKPPENEFQIPNVITANGDEFNQYFVIDPLVPGIALKIFNRWGREVYQSGNYKNNWDGENLAAGTYFYVLSIGCIEGKKGIVNLFR